MSDSIEKTVLLQINTNAEDVKSQILSVGAALSELQAKQKVSDAGSKEFVQYASDIRNAKTEIRNLNKDLDNLGKANKQVEGSIAAQRAALSLATKAYNEADPAIREKMIPNIKKLSDELKKNEAAIGDNRREVGNYAIAGNALRENLGELTSVFNTGIATFHQFQSGVKSANEQLKLASKAAAEAKKAQQELAAAQDVLKKAKMAGAEAEKAFAAGTITTGEAMRAQTVIQAAEISVTEAQITVTKSATIAQAGFNAAMGTGVIGILVLAIAGLVAYFNQTNEGSKALQRGLAALNAVFQVLLGVITPIGKAISDSFGGTEGILKTFGGAITLIIEPLVTLAKVFYDIAHGDFKGALKDGTDGLKKMGQATLDTLNGVINLTNGIKNGIAAGAEALGKIDLSKAARAGQETALARQAQVKAEREFGVTQVKVEGEIEVLKIKAARRDLQAGERQKALNEARKLENGLLTDKVKLAEQNLAVTEREEKLLSKKDPEKTAEAQKRVNEAQAQAAVGEANIDRIEGRINQKRTKENDKAAAEALKINEIRLASMAREMEANEDARSKELTQQDEFFRKELDKAKGNAAAIAQLKSEQAARRQQTAEKYAKEDQLKLETLQKEAAGIAVAAIKDTQVKIISSIDEATFQRLRKLSDENEASRKITIQQQAAILALRKSGGNAEADQLQIALNRELAIMQTNNQLAEIIVKDGEQKKADARRKFLLDEAVNNAEIQKAGSGKNIDQQYQAEVSLQAAKYAKEQEMARGNASQLALIDARYTAQRKETALKYSEAKTNIAEAEIQGFGNIAKGLEGLVKKNSGAYKAMLIAQRAAAIASVIINTTKAVSRTNADLGYPAAIPMDAVLIAQGAIQVATIAAQKFNRGGFVSDSRGSMVSGAGTGTSDSIPAYLSNGESVINAKSTAMFAPILSQINEIGGGRAFAAPYAGKTFAQGGVYSDGGSAARMYSQPVANNSNLANSLAFQLINNPQPIMVDVKEINTVQSRVATVQNRVNL